MEETCYLVNFDVALSKYILIVHLNNKKTTMFKETVMIRPVIPGWAGGGGESGRLSSLKLKFSMV